MRPSPPRSVRLTAAWACTFQMPPQAKRVSAAATRFRVGPVPLVRDDERGLALAEQVALHAHQVVGGWGRRARGLRLAVDRREERDRVPPILPDSLAAPIGVTMRRV